MKSRVERSWFGRRPSLSAPALPDRSAISRNGSGLARALAAVPFVLLAGCTNDTELFPQTWMAPRSDYAQELFDLTMLTVYLGVGVGIMVFLLLAWIMIRYRYRPGMGEPAQVHGNTRLELAWTIFPAVLLAIIAVPTVRVIFETQPSEPPANAVTIDVVGWQWWWEFRYPLENGDTIITANEVHIPAGQPIHLRLTSADVIHNTWVPQLFGKRYNIPNRVNHIHFTANEPGVYLGQCAEFCGESHALMKKRMIVHTPEGFQQWLEDQARPAFTIQEPAATAADSALLIGQQIATSGTCAACHVIRGTAAEFGRAGPDLTHFARRRTLAAGIVENNADNLAAWLRDPPAMKPGSRMPNLNLTEEEIRYLVAYLQMLY